MQVDANYHRFVSKHLFFITESLHAQEGWYSLLHCMCSLYLAHFSKPHKLQWVKRIHGHDNNLGKKLIILFCRTIQGHCVVLWTTYLLLETDASAYLLPPMVLEEYWLYRSYLCVRQQWLVVTVFLLETEHHSFILHYLPLICLVISMFLHLLGFCGHNCYIVL